MPITAADPSAALVSAARPLDLLTPARTAGWQSANACTVPEIHAGDVMLRLGSQRIPVRQLVNGPGAEERIERVADSLLPGYFPEQFIVLHGFSTEQTERVRRRLHRAGFRFLVGNLAEYVKWLKTRLGPLASVAYDSPVRALVEPLLCFIRKPQPVKPVPVRGDYSASGIAPSFKLGQLGVQAFETILSHQLGQQKFVNVEAEPSWQKRDVDLLVQLERLIRVEIKTEDYASSNLSLEDIGNVTKGTPGWLHFSECDVLVSIAWPAGEVWIQNFSRVKEWALSGLQAGRRTNPPSGWPPSTRCLILSTIRSFCVSRISSRSRTETSSNIRPSSRSATPRAS
jgi:hypothetical protein